METDEEDIRNHILVTKFGYLDDVDSNPPSYQNKRTKL